jgi:hypothetical protein
MQFFLNNREFSQCLLYFIFFPHLFISSFKKRALDPEFYFRTKSRDGARKGGGGGYRFLTIIYTLVFSNKVVAAISFSK